MREVLISIQPRWVEKIVRGEKTVEVRRTRPKCELPFKCYIYCTKGKPTFTQSAFCDEVSNGKVIGEFVCDRIRCEKEVADGLVDIVLESTSCVSARELVEYANGNVLYSWHIIDLVVYDEPRELSEFATVDNEAVQNCNHRVQSYFDGFCNSGYLKCGFYCSVKDDWCDKCKTKPITRPPQSWQFCVATEPRQTAD